MSFQAKQRGKRVLTRASSPSKALLSDYQSSHTCSPPLAWPASFHTRYSLIGRWSKYSETSRRAHRNPVGNALKSADLMKPSCGGCKLLSQTPIYSGRGFSGHDFSFLFNRVIPLRLNTVHLLMGDPAKTHSYKHTLS